MKRLIMVALAATALSAPAHADGLQFNCRSAAYYGTYMTNCALESSPAPRKLTAEEVAAQEREAAKWEAFCHPVKVPDDEGVIHLRYAHKGCEFGRSE
jgi:hypothetical protein